MFSFKSRYVCVLSFFCGVVVTVFINSISRSLFENDVEQLEKSFFEDPNTELLLKQTKNDIVTAHSSVVQVPRSVYSKSTINEKQSASFSWLSTLFRKVSHAHVDGRVNGKKIRLLCWIMTGPANHLDKAIHVKRTWGRRCDKLIFISSQNDSSLPAIGIKGTTEGRDGLWAKTRGAFKLIYYKYLDDADFFFKADDDTYAIVENLRYFLENYNSSQSYYFGCLFFPTWSHRKYHSGGAGYVLSKGAVVNLVQKAFRSSRCPRGLEGGDEDSNIGQCLAMVNTTFIDTRDEKGRYRSLPLPPTRHLIPGRLPQWWHKYTMFPQMTGFSCCSDLAISFHYIPPIDMYLYEYLIYHVRIQGVQNDASVTKDTLKYNRTLIIENFPVLDYSTSKYSH